MAYNQTQVFSELIVIDESITRTYNASLSENGNIFLSFGKDFFHKQDDRSIFLMPKIFTATLNIGDPHSYFEFRCNEINIRKKQDKVVGIDYVFVNNVCSLLNKRRIIKESKIKVDILKCDFLEDSNFFHEYDQFFLKYKKENPNTTYYNKHIGSFSSMYFYNGDSIKVFKNFLEIQDEQTIKNELLKTNDTTLEGNIEWF